MRRYADDVDTTTHPSQCTKRLYRSKRRALAAHKRAGHRLRVYWCKRCRGWHTTNQDKSFEGHAHG